MKPPFNILLVRGDGVRVVRLSVPRWIGWGVVGVIGGVALTIAGLSGEYAFLKQQGRHVAALRGALAEQQGLMASFQKRIASVRKEIIAWRALHTGMWEAFGPEVVSSQKPEGIGGGTPDEDAADAAVAHDLSGELELLALNVADEDRRLRDLERVVSRAGKLVSTLPLRWPVRGRVTSKYGPRRSPWSGVREHHGGIDIGSPSGTLIRSPAAGRVVTAGAGGDYGRHVKLDHGNGVRSLYGHLRKIEVKAGQYVEKGDVIGQVGSTGRSTGPHLHYEVRVQGKAVDPRGFIWDGQPAREALALKTPANSSSARTKGLPLAR